MSILNGNAGLSVSETSSSPPSFPLDFISVMPIAAWWTRKLFAGNVADDISALRVSDSVSQNIPFSPNGVINAANLAAFSTINNSRLDIWYDQVPPGANLNLSGGFFNQGPLIYDGITGIELEGTIPVANFNGDSLGRNDALGLVGNQSITIAWKMICTNPLTAPTLLCLGGSVSPELVLYVLSDNINDFVLVYKQSTLLQLYWQLPLNTITLYRGYIFSMPVSGYSNSCTLNIDGIDQGPPTSVTPGVVNFTNQQTLLGDFVGGGFPFNGKIPGMIIYNSVLTGNDLSILQSFLLSQ